MTSTQLQQIVELNSRGTQMYCNGQLISAREAYVEVLQLLRSLYEGSLIRIDIANNETTLNVDHNRINVTVYDTEDRESHIDTSTFVIHPMDDAVSEKFAIYTGAIRLDHDANHAIESITAVTVYNLALAFHIEGLTGKDISSRASTVALVKALKLYHQASTLVFDVHREDNEEDSVAELAIMLAAIYTNMAQIYRDCFQDDKKTNEALERLLCVTDWMESELVANGMLPLRDYEIFLSVLEPLNDRAGGLYFYYCAPVA